MRLAILAFNVCEFNRYTLHLINGGFTNRFMVKAAEQDGQDTYNRFILYKPEHYRFSGAYCNSMPRVHPGPL